MAQSKFYDPKANLTGKSILVTGGTGSFGKRFIKTVLERYQPRRLVIYSRDELKQYEMQQELSPQQYPCLRYFIGDVRDQQRLETALRNIDFVVHAAALKHVPIAEYNPTECIHTNVTGAENVVHASIRNRVQQVIALSTDKAANPVNLYGASKLASDKIFVASNSLGGPVGTRFSVVRYGNVVGSRGSVMPFFKKLIEQGANKLPITDPRMTRFMITLQEGVDFVLSCFQNERSAGGGDIFVPKIPSIKITDLARFMAPGLEQEVIGIRPGEKLHEVMVTEDDSRTTIDLGDRYAIRPAFPFWEAAQQGVKPTNLVADGFRYSSDNNDDWLDESTLKAMLADVI